MSVREKIKKISLFGSFKDDEQALTKIEEIINEKKYQPDNYIIKEGETGTTMYILSKGIVRVEKKTLHGDSYPVVNLSADMNVFFGELALLDNDHRSASVITLSETECYEISKNDFDALCQNDPYLGYMIMREIAKSLAGKLRKTTRDNLVLIEALCSQDSEMVHI
jgi:CRP/FNR family transcriptional regulator, cyclic AMP receptor protein